MRRVEHVEICDQVCGLGFRAELIEFRIQGLFGLGVSTRF